MAPSIFSIHSFILKDTFGGWMEKMDGAINSPRSAFGGRPLREHTSDHRLLPFDVKALPILGNSMKDGYGSLHYSFKDGVALTSKGSRL